MNKNKSEFVGGKRTHDLGNMQISVNIFSLEGTGITNKRSLFNFSGGNGMQTVSKVQIGETSGTGYSAYGLSRALIGTMN